MSGLRSEDQFLELIDQCFTGEDRRVLLGRGDDAAVLSCPGRVALTTDLFLEDQHFRRAYFEPEDVGHKALAVNLSDLAAMGARPMGFCLGLMAPPEVPADYWRRLFTGMSELATRARCPLVGGDLSRAGSIGLSITAWGEPVPRAGWKPGRGPAAPFLTRRGAEPGETLFVLLPEGGGLGLARAGLLALEAAFDSDDPQAIADAKARHPQAVAAHLRPEPLSEAGILLARVPQATALMDLSDGLARDLPRLLGHGYSGSHPQEAPLGAVLDLDPAGLHPELLAIAHELGLDPLETAVLGGEDYGLLGSTTDLSALGGLPGKLVPLGQVTDDGRITVNDRPWPGQGFDHFAG